MYQLYIIPTKNKSRLFDSFYNYSPDTMFSEKIFKTNYITFFYNIT